jgi:photosystem II stability/assembly factor-like uncharacterized protein
MRLLLATQSEVMVVDPEVSGMVAADGIGDLRPTCLTADRGVPGRAWCGTHRGGVLRSEDGGASWRRVGLEDRSIMALSASPAEANVVWAGTEPSEVWRSEDDGNTWQPTRPLQELPSSGEWAFPPRPNTHHVRWIACHPQQAGRLWVAVEAGALVSTSDGGRSWRDRVPGGPRDTHELAIHPEAPETLRAAAGDGYFESRDGGVSWARPRAGLEVGYLRSVAVDPGRPDVVLVSAATHAHAAYVAGSSDGRLYRRAGEDRWERVADGWPDPPATIAPLLLAGSRPGEFWAADERGIHASDDGGSRWRQLVSYPRSIHHLRGLAFLA